MSNESDKPGVHTESNVSSGFFSYRKNPSPPSTTPVLIDNLSLRVRIATAMPEAGQYPAGDIPKRRFLGPEHHSSAFANPFIYPAHRGRHCLKLFGQHSLRTNGRRIYRHVIGNPLPHKTGHDDKILTEDKQHNQLSDGELANLIELAGSANQEPYTWQLTRMLGTVLKSYNETMTTYGLEVFNPPENYRRYLSIERVEAYFEVIGIFDYYEVTQALQKVLYRYFRASDKRRHRFEKSSDKADQDTYTTWVISPELVSSEFSNGRDDSDLIRKLLKAGMSYRNISVVAKCSHGSVSAEKRLILLEEKQRLEKERQQKEKQEIEAKALLADEAKWASFQNLSSAEPSSRGEACSVDKEGA